MTGNQLEAHLVQVAQGDMSALDAIYREFYHPVYLLVVSLAKEPALAEDVTQEVFLTVRACAGRYKPGTNPRAWLFGITKNIARYFLRMSRRADQPGEEAMDRLPAAGELEADCLSGILTCQALSVLTPRENPVVVLHVFGGFSLSEIARYLKVPYGTVLWRYAEGKKRIKRFYQQVDEQERRDTREQ